MTTFNISKNDRKAMLTKKTPLLLNYLLIGALLLVFSATSRANAGNDKEEGTEEKRPANKTTKNTTSGFSIHGNWCGPNHPVDINNASNPIDLLDQQCKTHDLCYVNKGELDCGCDRTMVKEIDKTQHNKLYTPQQYFIAQNIKMHFAISPCNGDIDGNKMLPTRVLTRIYKGTKRRVVNTYEQFIGRHFSDNIELGNQPEKDTLEEKR